MCWGEEFAQSLLFLFSWLVYLAADCYNAQYHQHSGSSFNLGGCGRDEYGCLMSDWYVGMRKEWRKENKDNGW